MNPVAQVFVRAWQALTGGANPAGLRIRPRRQRVFAGARVDRLTEDFFSGTTSGSGEMRTDLRRLRNRSRTLYRDTAEAKRFCSLFPENVIGESGILLKPAALLRDGNRDARVNDAVLEAWERWGEPEHCTVDGQLGIVELEQLLTQLWPMDGEALVRMVDGVGEFGFGLQILDPDQLDETYNVEPMAGGPWIRQGIELDRWGRPIAYHIWEGHPNDNRRGNRIRLPAKDIIHLYLPWRPGARRAPPWLHAGITNINMLAGYFEAALVAARVAASAMGTIKGADDEDPSTDDQPTESETPVDFQPGKWFKLAPGEEANLHDPKHPTTAFSDFYKGSVRAIAQAGNVSYTSLSGDLEAVNYSSIRAGMLSERVLFRMMQQRMIRYFCQRVYRRWLPMAQLTGQVAISAADISRAMRVRWQPKGFPWVDPLKDIEALRAEIALGVNSRTRAAAERGLDFEKVLEELDAEARLAKEYGVNVSGAEVTMPPEESTTTKPGDGRTLRIANA